MQIRQVVPVAIAVVGSAVFGAAEVPTWEGLRTPAYTVNYHEWFWGQTDGTHGAEKHQGIWRFDPERNSWRRLTPFFYNALGYPASHYSGHGSYLTTTGDRLLFEGLGVWIEVDVASGRFVRRYTPGFFRGVGGWQVQGPAIGSAEGAGLGLAEGVFGPPRCVRKELSAMAELCEPLAIPPSEAKVSGDFAVLFRWAQPSGPETQLADLRGTPDQTLLDNNSWGRVLSFDAGRGGFWLSSYLNRNTALVFLPVRNGVLDMASVSRRTLPPSLVGDYVKLAQYSPMDDAMYYVSQSDPLGESSFFKVDLTDLTRTTFVNSDPKAMIPITLASLPQLPPSTFEQLVPIVVRAPGVGGTLWSSELWLYNPSASASTVTLRRIVKPGVSKTIELPAHGSYRVSDVVTWLGGGSSGDGTTHDGLVIASPYRLGEQVVAASRVWTPSLDPGESVRGGTMGQAVPAVPGDTGYSNHLGPLTDDDPSLGNVEYLTGKPATYILDHRVPGRFRHNMGFANDSDESVTIDLTWGYSIGLFWPLPTGWPGEGAKQSITVVPHSVKIVNLETLFPAAVQAWMPSQVKVESEQPIALWFSMVDNRTGDGIHVPYSLFWLVGDDASHVAMPAMAHLPGANGTVWRSDVYIAAKEEVGHSIGGYDDIFGRFAPAWPTSCGGSAQSGPLAKRLSGVRPSPATYEYEVGWRTIFPDVVHLFDACAQDENVRGTFELRSSSWMSGFGRTLTTRADGGTYGEMMPFYPPYGWPVQHFAGIEIGPRFRLNLGLYNGDPDHAIRHRLTLYAADGTKAAEREVTLAPHASVQERLETMLGRPLDSFAEGTYGLTVLPLDDTPHGVQGRSWAYVSMVDNVTGDPTNWW
ncbi:MAG: hypothetical protein KA072_13040 [Thermoanaerobaculaceae bacterium]|nr:hypothetical protein [Thermoanaerobaculaceae bacterium]